MKQFKAAKREANRAEVQNYVSKHNHTVVKPSQVATSKIDIDARLEDLELVKRMILES